MADLDSILASLVDSKITESSMDEATKTRGSERSGEDDEIDGAISFDSILCAALSSNKRLFVRCGKQAEFFKTFLDDAWGEVPDNVSCYSMAYGETVVLFKPFAEVTACIVMGLQSLSKQRGFSVLDEILDVYFEAMSIFEEQLKQVDFPGKCEEFGAYLEERIEEMIGEMRSEAVAPHKKEPLLPYPDAPYAYLVKKPYEDMPTPEEFAKMAGQAGGKKGKKRDEDEDGREAEEPSKESEGSAKKQRDGSLASAGDSESELKAKENAGKKNSAGESDRIAENEILTVRSPLPSQHGDAADSSKSVGVSGALPSPASVAGEEEKAKELAPVSGVDEPPPSSFDSAFPGDSPPTFGDIKVKSATEYEKLYDLKKIGKNRSHHRQLSNSMSTGELLPSPSSVGSSPGHKLPPSGSPSAATTATTASPLNAKFSGGGAIPPAPFTRVEIAENVSSKSRFSDFAPVEKPRDKVVEPPNEESYISRPEEKAAASEHNDAEKSKDVKSFAMSGRSYSAISAREGLNLPTPPLLGGIKAHGASDKEGDKDFLAATKKASAWPAAPDHGADFLNSRRAQSAPKGGTDLNRRMSLDSSMAYGHDSRIGALRAKYGNSVLPGQLGEDDDEGESDDDFEDAKEESDNEEEERRGKDRKAEGEDGAPSQAKRIEEVRKHLSFLRRSNQPKKPLPTAGGAASAPKKFGFGSHSRVLDDAGAKVSWFGGSTSSSSPSAAKAAPKASSGVLQPNKNPLPTKKRWGQKVWERLEGSTGESSKQSEVFGVKK